jgi:hypothetical protein
MARMVGAELRWAHIRVSSAPLPEPGEEEEELSTQAWDRYGPDICAELPLSVVDPLLTAYGVIGMNQGMRKGNKTLAEAAAGLSTTTEGRAAIEEHRAVLQSARDQLLRAIGKGINALHPYMGDTEPIGEATLAQREAREQPDA